MKASARLRRTSHSRRLEREDGSAVCEHLRVADAPHTRMRGLLGRAELPPGEGLLIEPTGSIHMFFMRFPIDAVFLDRELRVLGTRERLAPWRVAGRRRAKAVLELAAGEVGLRGIEVGQQLRLVEVRDE